MSTTDIGCGFAPCGFAPCGWGSPATADMPPTVIFPDPASGLSLSARRIDPVTQQFVFGTNGLIQGMTTAQQSIWLAIATMRGSASYALVGQDFLTIQDNGTDVQAVITNRVQVAVAPLVQAQIVSLQSVNIMPVNEDGQFISIDWKDLTTGLDDNTLA